MDIRGYTTPSLNCYSNQKVFKFSFKKQSALNLNLNINLDGANWLPCSNRCLSCFFYLSEEMEPMNSYFLVIPGKRNFWNPVAKFDK